MGRKQGLDDLKEISLSPLYLCQLQFQKDMARSGVTIIPWESHMINAFHGFVGMGKKKVQDYPAFLERHKIPWLAVRAWDKPQSFI